MVIYNKCFQILELSQPNLKGLQTAQSELHFFRRLCTSRILRDTSEREGQETRNDTGSTGDDESSTSSSFHQSYHRRSYERKRTDYQKATGSGTGSRPISYMASPSTTHYQRLNIEPSAGIEAIKSAYYSLSKQYHPDIVGKNNPDAVENFRLITDAYDTLSDPKSKAEYDKQVLPDMESPLEPAYSSWRPKGYGDQDRETIYRMQEAHRIFQNKQDEALAREKERNPNKFRAGSFKRHDNDDSDLERVANQLRSMAERKKSHGAFQEDGSDNFYRVHLYSTVIRRQDDLRARRDFANLRNDSPWMPLVFVISFSVLLMATAFDLVYEFDFAAILDRKLGVTFTKETDVKSEN